MGHLLALLHDQKKKKKKLIIRNKSFVGRNSLCLLQCWNTEVIRNHIYNPKSEHAGKMSIVWMKLWDKTSVYSPQKKQLKIIQNIGCWLRRLEEVLKV